MSTLLTCLCSPDCVSCTETIPFKRKSIPRSEPVTSQGIMAETDAEVFALRLRLERALADHADVYQQVSASFRKLQFTDILRSLALTWLGMM